MLGMTFPVVVVIHFSLLLEHRLVIGFCDDCWTVCKVVGFVINEAGGLVIPCDTLARGRNTLLLRSARWYILHIYLKV